MKWYQNLYVFVAFALGGIFTNYYEEMYETLFEQSVPTSIYTFNILLFLLLFSLVDNTIKNKNLFNSGGILSIALLFLFQMMNLHGVINQENTFIREEIYQHIYYAYGYIYVMIQFLILFYLLSLVTIGVLYVLFHSVFGEYDHKRSKNEKKGNGALALRSPEERAVIKHLPALAKEIDTLNQRIQSVLKDASTADTEDVHHLMSVIEKLNESITLHKTLSDDAQNETIAHIGEMLNVLHANVAHVATKHEEYIKNEIHKKYEFVKGKQQ